MDQQKMTFELTLSRWHNVSKRLANLAKEAGDKALAGFGGARVDGYAGEAQTKALTARQKEASEGLALALALQEDIGSIREAIGQANARAGVAALLAKQESINRSSKLLREIVAAQKPEMVPLEGLADYKPLSTSEPRFFRGSEGGAVSVSLMPQEELDRVKAQLAALQAEAFAVADQINDLNREKISASVSAQAARLAGLAA
jgi:hypothetical protein